MAMQVTAADHAKTDHVALSQLDDLAQSDSRPLYVLTGVWPFDFFPTKIVIDRKKITFRDQLFFFTSQSQSILIADVMSVMVDTGLLFSSLSVIDRHFPQDTIVVKYLRDHEAKKARRLIQGLILADKENIDLTNVPDDQLIEKLEEIGKTRLHVA